MRNAAAGLIALIVVLALTRLTVATEFQVDERFQATWDRTDRPVAAGVTSRTWVWGPHPIGPAFDEPYAESPSGERPVQYFDKGRMEITNPTTNARDGWRVTTGLLAKEMVTGRVQIGDDAFEQRDPAEINVAGDLDDRWAPTYATFSRLLDASSHGPGYLIAEQLSRGGEVRTNLTFPLSYQVAIAVHIGETGHSIAEPFWHFMTSAGTVSTEGNMTYGALFPNAFYATGFPITEPYWATVKVDGLRTDVLIQCFERRCLTYTPTNPEGWRVESGNVGRHYYLWRHGAPGPQR